MTIECRETRFGKPVGEPTPVEPGTKEWLNLRSFIITTVGSKIRVDSPDEITFTIEEYPGMPPIINEVYKREEINEQQFQTSPTISVSDLVSWHRRHYSWREDK